MKRRDVLTAAVATMAAAAPMAATGGGRDDDAPPVGSWFGTVVATNPPLGQFDSLISLNTDGIVIESRRYLVKPTPFGDLLETTGHGAWKRTARNRYEVFFRFILQSADTGLPFGTDNVRMKLRVEARSGRLVGTFVSQIRDTSDTVLIEVGGEYSASPITV